MCPSLRCSWPRRGLGVGARGAEVVGAEALEWLPSERDKAPAQEETPERQRPEGPSGHAALAAPRAPACVLTQAPHSGMERALATAHATSRARLRQAVHREAHASQRSSCAAAPPRRGPGSGHGHPPCRNGAICFRMLITPLFLAHSIIFNIFLLLLKGNIRELKA